MTEASLQRPAVAGGKGQRVRQRIVQAADRLFYEHGYSQTSFSDIADAATIPRGNFYYYFKSKDEILTAVIDERMRTVAALFDDWDSASDQPLERLKGCAAVLVGRQQEVLCYGCPMGSLNMELVKSPEHLRVQAMRLFDVFLDWMQTQFEALGKGGTSRVLALRLLGDMQGVALMASVYRDGDYLMREVRRIQCWLDEEIENNGN